jgi:hypothetical protein
MLGSEEQFSSIKLVSYSVGRSGRRALIKTPIHADRIFEILDIKFPQIFVANFSLNFVALNKTEVIPDVARLLPLNL